MTAATLLRIGIIGTSVFAAVGIAEGGKGARADDPNARATVEFVEVAGFDCLQPLAHASGPELADYEAAERRWLESHHPGYHAWKWKRVLVLSPGSGERARPGSVQVTRDTAYLSLPGGTTVSVCFDVEPADFRRELRGLAEYRPESAPGDD